MIKQIKLRDRILPDDSRGEEIFNMVSHIAGGVSYMRAAAKSLAAIFIWSFIYLSSWAVFCNASALFYT